MIKLVSRGRYFLFVGLCLLLAACHSLPPVGEQLPVLNEHKLYQVTELEEQQSKLQSLLIIEPQTDDIWRWIQVDALGAPISRQVLQQGQWRNDGFLPPNPQARALFIAVYVYLSREAGGLDKVPTETLAEIRVEEQLDSVLLSYQDKQWLIKSLPTEADRELD